MPSSSAGKSWLSGTCSMLGLDKRFHIVLLLLKSASSSLSTKLKNKTLETAITSYFGVWMHNHKEKDAGNELDSGFFFGKYLLLFWIGIVLVCTSSPNNIGITRSEVWSKCLAL